ncbi:MAG: ATP-binding protein, partial [Nodosilinea sp.]
TDMLRLKAESKRLTLKVDICCDLSPYICTDSHKLRQVLLNLLSNAIKFTQDGYVILRIRRGLLSPSVRCSSSAEKRSPETAEVMSLRFEVEDSGVGIAPSDLDLIFEPFGQTINGRHSQEGTGLGLPISCQFVRLLGGKLDVSSLLGAGSTFGFEIPVQVADSAVVEPVSRQVLAIAPDQPQYRILVVEDDRANRVFLHNLLTNLGFEVQTAINGQDGVEQWQTWQPHLIFMDIRMPVMDGYEATRFIRQQEQTLRLGQHLPTKIVILSAGVFEVSESDVNPAGFDTFIAKPLYETEITGAIAQHLGVQYLYAPSATAAETSSTASTALTAEALKGISLDWADQFHNALMQLDQDQMLALVAGMSAEQAPIAQALSQKIEDFDYDILLDVTQSILNGQP